MWSTISAALNVLSGGVDIVKGWMGMKKTAADQKAGADAATVKAQADALGEVKEANDAQSSVDAAGDAALDGMRDRWTRP